ncbi:MAG: TIGR00282 family metallophosphoesterase [Fimbriimonadaceae bacterium]
MTYRVLFLGDVVGRPGREALRRELPSLTRQWEPLFIIANGENAAGGVGITSDIAESMFALGIDVVTLGNHAFNKREVFPYLNSSAAIVRPANMPGGNPGRGALEVTKDGVTLYVANLCGRVFMDAYDDPFRAVDDMLASVETPHRVIDFHAEATSEKIALAWHLDGRATAVLGTHTHVPTADERILPGGTAAITDVGMTGPYESVLGMNKDVVLSRFKTGMPARFEVADAIGVISGVVLDVERMTGRATSIKRVRSDA